MNNQRLNYAWYLKQNAKTLENYAGQWITILDDYIVMSGKNLKHVLEKTDKKFPRRESFLVKVPAKTTYCL